jgi:stage V sporulation protein SpoVS
MANLIVVLASTDLSCLAEQIRRFIRQDESLVLLAIGSGSVFVAVTAVGLARFLLAPDYLDVVLVPVFCDLDEAGNKRSALRVYADWPGRKFPRLRDLPVAS